MPNQACTGCGGTGKVTKQVKRRTRIPQPDGSWKDHIETETVTSDCGSCGGTGWVKQ
jgi:hypothetical protein